MKLRFAILGAAAALALGTGSAVAMGDRDTHGDAVASAARTTCPHGPDAAHGECVSAIASTEAQEKESSEPEGSAESGRVKTCKAADATEDKTEKKPSKGDKAAKAADRAEDKTEHTQLRVCLSTGTA